MPEIPEHRIKRLSMRSMRRGIKEMDIILSAYADAELPRMSEDKIALYDALLDENDQDLYSWVTGQTIPPERFQYLLGEIAQTFQK
ncbi:succinate dehydrogenase assembly factor 2 [Planktotalea sp.]|uniref:succinate dehydrogenase assembly factor 2 n=1 Tax=Planktotalea sp. TaxID=2029877 RepID=UPI0025F41901|nr:succinate dehydrogenase assembly factor 2 [Planktotalea sp.]